MKKKLLTAAVLVLAAVALVIATVFTTIAYLTSSSAVSNTFTVGNVGIKMFESNVDADGKAVADTDINGVMKDSDGNNYHLMPGKTYDKDPTIYIDSSSDASYLFVKVRNNIASIEYGNFVHSNGSVSVADAEKPTIEEQMIAYNWVKYAETATGTVYVYTDGSKALPVGGTSGISRVDVFDTFSIDKHADISLYGGAKVTLTAFAIQIAGFEDNPATADKDEAVDAAWSAIVETYPYENGVTANN